ncbi:MAG TPA: hypothetical protein VEL73_02590, partial [Mycobacteriales bacterium]|nr:hypothetical protein [Mycobacteriales bacterium]
RYCPICRAVAVLRGERPEVTDRLADAVTAAATALAAVADALARPKREGRRPDRPDATGPDGPADEPAGEGRPWRSATPAARTRDGGRVQERRVQAIPIDPVLDLGI